MVTLTFIEFWTSRYDSANYPDGFYSKHIQLLHAPDTSYKRFQESLIALLHWKDRKASVYTKGQLNAKPNTLSRIPALTKKEVQELQREFLAFRSNPKYSVDQFYTFLTEKMQFWNSLVIPIFVCHLARPVDVPIFDQHVFRAMNALQGSSKVNQLPKSWSDYELYQKFYVAIGKETKAEKDSDWRNIDKALWTFGQFLGRVVKQEETRSNEGKLLKSTRVRTDTGLAARSLYYKRQGNTNGASIAKACKDLAIPVQSLPSSYREYPGSIFHLWKKRNEEADNGPDN